MYPLCCFMTTLGYLGSWFVVEPPDSHPAVAFYLHQSIPFVLSHFFCYCLFGFVILVFCMLCSWQVINHRPSIHQSIN